MVEYSCSDEETDIPSVEPANPVKDISAVQAPTEQNIKKKKISPPKGSKQGSILKFFSKKSN